MFILDGRPLSPDSPFEHNGISYPANWLRLASPEERIAVGIEEVPDPPAYDQRFYWGYDDKGNLIPKDHAQLVEQWTQQTRTTAGTLLNPSDWMVIREQDNGVAVPAEWRTWRETVRLAAGSKVYEIQQTTTTEQLANYLMSSAYTSWPADPNSPAPAPAPVEDATEEPVASGEAVDVGIG